MNTSNFQKLYLINKCLCSPLEAMFSILVFIVSKDAGATPLQIAVFTASKPVVSLFSLYLCSLIVNKPHRIRPFLMTINLIGCLPCFFFSLTDDPWFYIASFALFTTASRASVPAWSEILKSTIGLNKIAKCVSIGTSINYTAILFLPLIVSFWMDQNATIWKIVFCTFALLQMINVFVVLLKVKLEAQPVISHKQPIYLLVPWKQAWETLKASPPFAHYLLMFFLGGAGLVAMQSVLPIYFKESLNLSYTQLTLAFSFCKGISFLASSPFWAKYANRMSLFLLNCAVNLLSCLFIAFILTSKFYLGWLYIAYLMYGAMQSGCEISYTVSGPVFSREKESTPYSNLNLILVGLRGFLSPILGQVIFINYGSFSVFFTAFVLCLASLIYAFWLDRFYAKQSFCSA